MMRVKKNNNKNEYVTCRKHFLKRKIDFQSKYNQFRKNYTYYLDAICCLDTETSKINLGTREKEEWYGWLYQWAFCINDDVCIGRTPSELLNELDRLQEMYKLDDTHKMVIYIHNLSYDMTYLLRFMYERDYDTNLFLLDSHKILTVKYKCFEFRDSYRLSNMSLEKWCEQLETDTRKAVGTIDYDEIRFQDSELTIDDWFYQVNDVLSMKECIEIELRENNDNLFTIPLTSTGYVRRDCRNAVLRDSEYRKFFEKTALNEHEYTALNLAFSGGYTHANRFIVNKTVVAKDGCFIGHNDKKSFYPSTQQMRYFPISKFAKCYEWNGIDKPQKIEKFNGFLKSKCCLCQIAIKDAKLHKDVTAPYLQACKLVGNYKNLKCDNGRVLSFSGIATMWCLELDIDILRLQYDCEIYVLEMYISNQGRFPEQFRKVIDKYFEAKETLKKVGGYYYMKSKNKLNAIYGMSVSRLIREDINYNFETAKYNRDKIIDKSKREKILQKYYNSRKSFFPYQLGVWVTAHCRNELLHLISDCIGYENFLYSDTDSIFYIETEENKKKLEEHNKKIIEENKKLDLGLEHDGKTSYYNLFEREESEEEHNRIKKFRTLHSKCYCFVDETDKLHVTIAGISKDNKKQGKERVTSADELGDIENLKDDFTFYECGGTISKYVSRETCVIDINGHKTELADACIILKHEKTINELSDDFEIYEVEEN